MYHYNDHPFTTMERPSFDVKPDRYAEVNYYSEASSESHSCDGDADDDSFISAEERVRLNDEYFAKMTPTSVDTTRRTFDRLLRVCDGGDGDNDTEDDDDEASTYSSDLLSIASHDVPEEEEDDDLSYASTEQLPFCHPILSPPRSPRKSYFSDSKHTTSSSPKPKQYAAQIEQSIPSLDEITDSSTFASHQDLSLSQSQSSDMLEAEENDLPLSSFQEIEHSIQLIQKMKTKIKNLKQFSYNHNRFHCADKGALSMSLSQDATTPQHHNSGSSNNTSVYDTQSSRRLNEIRSRLRSLEKFSTIQHSDCQSLVNEPCKRINNQVRHFFQDQTGTSDQNTPCCKTLFFNQNQYDASKAEAMLNSSKSKSRHHLGNNDNVVAQVLMRLSREFLMFFFILSCFYFLYLTRRDADLNALQVKLNQVKMFERALTIVHEKKLWGYTRRGPFRRFFPNS